MAFSWHQTLRFVDGIAEQRAHIEEACTDVSRDPGTIGVTVGVHVAISELVKDPELNPETTLHGTPEEIADAFWACEAARVSQIICGALADMISAYISQVIARVTEAMAMAIAIARPSFRRS